MEEGREYGSGNFCELLNLKESHTKVIIQGLSDDIEMLGSNYARCYKKKRISNDCLWLQIGYKNCENTEKINIFRK